MQALLCAMHKIRLKFTNSKVSSGTDVHGSRKKSTRKKSPEKLILPRKKSLTLNFFRSVFVIF